MNNGNQLRNLQALQRQKYDAERAEYKLYQQRCLYREIRAEVLAMFDPTVYDKKGIRTTAHFDKVARRVARRMGNRGALSPAAWLAAASNIREAAKPAKPKRRANIRWWDGTRYSPGCRAGNAESRWEASRS